MKALTYGFGVLLVGGFALTASCGGSSGDSSASAGTSSTTGGTFNGTGGTSNGTSGTFTGTGGTFVGSGGTSVGTGGTNTGTGGTGTGTGGTNTGTGGTGTGGATANPPTCPPAMPTPRSGDTCTVPPAMTPACVYATTSCTCRPNRNIGQAGAPAAGDGTLRCQALPPPCVEGAACTRGCIEPNNAGFCRCTNNKLACTGFGAAGAGGAG